MSRLEITAVFRLSGNAVVRKPTVAQLQAYLRRAENYGGVAGMKLAMADSRNIWYDPSPEERRLLYKARRAFRRWRRAVERSRKRRA
jgi:hypothetical protein